MAKTRIKTTPTRMQKEALIASAAVTTTNSNNVTEHVLKKRLTAFNSSILNQEAIPTAAVQSTIIVQPPKRTNSISSATSTISHTSDGHSSVESPPPATLSSTGTPTSSNGPTMAELTENAIKTLNAGLLAKTNALALKNRKVYMITEKCDDSNNGAGGGGGGILNISGAGKSANSGSVAGGQKRKMYLIMEEKESDVAEKLMKSECSNGSKKLTLFTDTANGQLPQKIEKILPEILNCIQAKEGGGGGVNGAGMAGNKNGAISISKASNDAHVKSQSLPHSTNGKSLPENTKGGICREEINKNERLPLTLPPKKNRTKIITTQFIPVNSSSCPMVTQGPVSTQLSKNDDIPNRERGITTVFCSNGNGNRNGNGNGNAESCIRYEKTSSATPVIVNANTLLVSGANNSTMRVNGSTVMSAAPQLHKNINLSTDFLFLMKMLPKLEGIPESHKNYVRTCIEDIINQYSTTDHEEDQ